MRAEELDTFFSDGSQFKQRDHLEAATLACDEDRVNKLNSPPAVRQNIPLPSLQLMRAPNRVQHRLPGLQAQMVRIIQAQHAPGLTELVVREALDGGLGCDGHEDREWDGAMREFEGACAGFCGLWISDCAGRAAFEVAYRAFGVQVEGQCRGR